MNKNSKDIRMLQIAAVILYRAIPNVSLQQSDNNLYDILAISSNDGLRFGIRVVSSSFSESNYYETYLDFLDTVDYSDNNYRIPIVLLSVNESAETAMIGIQVGWRLGQPVIFRKTSMMSVRKENANRILDAVKSMDESIRILSEHGMKIIKNINIQNISDNGMINHADMIYMRDFTEEYKMKPKVVVNERDRYNRLLTGIPENEYPNDILDNTILSVVKQKFPVANMKSKILLFSSELQELQNLSKSIRLTSEIFIEPDLQNIPDAVLHILNGIRLIHFRIDIFVGDPYSRSIFENLTFIKEEPLEGWLENYNNYSKAIKTLHSPNEFIL